MKTAVKLDVNKIHETKNYDLFKVLSGNRKISYNKHLETVYLDYGRFLEPIVVNERFEVIDGQHRLEVCRKLGVPVEFIIREGADLEETLSKNNQSRHWKLNDYLASYCGQGFEEYVKINQIFGELKGYVGDTSAIIATAMNGNGISGGSNKIFKSGKFTFSNYDEYMNFVSFTKRFSDVAQIKISGKLFVSLFQLYTLENFEGERFIQKAVTSNQIDRLALLSDEQLLLEELVLKIWNSGLSTSSPKFIKYFYNEQKQFVILTPRHEWAKG